MRKLLSAAQKDTVQIWDRRIEHMQITDWILSPTALHSDQEDERKRPKSAPFRKQSKISWGKKKEGRKKKFSISPAAITEAKMAMNEKLQNLEPLLPKENIKA